VVITARGRNAMASLYVARDFGVNVPERIQLFVDASALKALEAMLKHRPVDFFQHVEADGGYRRSC
jgi:hypothetical protein